MDRRRDFGVARCVVGGGMVGAEADRNHAAGGEADGFALAKDFRGVDQDAAGGGYLNLTFQDMEVGFMIIMDIDGEGGAEVANVG